MGKSRPGGFGRLTNFCGRSAAASFNENLAALVRFVDTGSMAKMHVRQHLGWRDAR